jgi:hypothetical protein
MSVIGLAQLRRRLIGSLRSLVHAHATDRALAVLLPGCAAVTPRSLTLRAVVARPAAFADETVTEPFSSSDFAGLKDVDSLGQLPGAPRAAAKLTQDAPGLELGIGSFAGGRGAGHEPGWPGTFASAIGRGTAARWK